MRLLDMHCDTLYRAYQEHGSLWDDRFHISLGKIGGISPYLQCMAVWIPDEYRGEDAWALFEGCLALLEQQLKDTDVRWCRSAGDIRQTAESRSTGIILTVEGGAVLGGRLERLQQMYDRGVRMMTLTWNGSNELGDGIGAEQDGGLTDFGKEAVREMERLGMIVDVSHAGEKLFWDVAKLARRPFVASHSDMRELAGHKRNLTGEQFRALVDCGGVCGLNFCRDFLNNDGTNASMYDIINHAQEMLSSGGEKTAAMGGDLDGADIPMDMDGIGTMPVLYELFCRHFGSGVSDDIFFGNAYRFFTENLR